jgi:arylsulfatase A-like enzyme
MIRLVLFLTASAATAFAAERAPQPNILFCLGDDWGYPHASILGDKTIKTPAFDRIAREGVLFANAHAAAPSCSPSRAAILTGQPIWRVENGSALLGFLPAKFPVYPELLERAGYRTGFAGKGYAPGKLGDRTRNAAGPEFASFRAFLTQRPAGAPFCFWLGSRNPHRPYKWESGKGKDLTAITVPPYLPDNAIIRQDIADYYANVETFDSQVADAIAALEAIGELDRTVVVITGDNGWPFPRSKATCYDSGTHEPLAIRWGGILHRGRLVADFVSLADLCPTFLELAGVPIPPSVTARSLVSVLRSDRSGWIDPTRDYVLTGMETHVPAHDLGGGKFGGYPIRSILTRDFHFIRNVAPDRWPAGDPPADFRSLTYPPLATKTQVGFADCDASPSKASIILDREQAAMRTHFARDFERRPTWELYDLRTDPHELRNVAGDPAYTEIAALLSEKLTAALKASGDPRASGGGAEFDGYTIGPVVWPK